jgi:hypothetical protein
VQRQRSPSEEFTYFLLHHFHVYFTGIVAVVAAQNLCLTGGDPHTSHLTPHTSHLTPHTSHLTPHT